MKTLAKSFVILLLASVSTHAQVGTNWLRNPSFESGSGSTLNNWTTSSGATRDIEPTHALTGTNSLRLTGAFTTLNGIAYALQTFNTTPGTAWDLSGYGVSFSGAGPQGSSYAALKMIWLNSNNQPIAPGVTLIGNPVGGSIPGIESLVTINSSSPADTWLAMNVRGIAPSGAARVQFEALFVNLSFPSQSGAAWLDDLSAGVYVPEPSTAALIGVGLFLSFIVMRARRN